MNPTELVEGTQAEAVGEEQEVGEAAVGFDYSTAGVDQD